MANEKRLIDVMDAVTKISKKVQPLLRIGSSTRKLYDDILDALADAPIVDAVEVVHAHWEYDPNGCDWGIGAYRCSHCGNRNGALPCNEDAHVYSYACSHYCPNCGAKMDGDGNG